MILRVTIENLFSFNEETSISFVAGKSVAHPEQVYRGKKRDDISALKSGIIYGANASGKSNIVKSISVLQTVALYGISTNLVEPFKLASDISRFSTIEVEFKMDDKYYAYGLKLSNKEIVEEWLYEINCRTERLVFERTMSEDNPVFSFGSIEGEDNRNFIHYISQGTPTNRSFLAEYVMRNGKGLSSIVSAFTWFKTRLRIVFPNTRYDGLIIRLEDDVEFAKATKSLLQYFNTGITDIRRTPIEKVEVDLPLVILNDLLSNAEINTRFTISSSSSMYIFDTDSTGKTSIFKQNAIHSADNHEVLFEMQEESDGSLRLLDFIPMLIDLKLNNVVYIIDEIDRSMHPLLSRKLLEYYFSNLSQDKDTQMIFTTHESHLLDLDIVRADEVWFVEKDNKGASKLTSLAEFKPRRDVMKGYLQGRYGAIPFFAPIKSLKW